MNTEWVDGSVRGVEETGDGEEKLEEGKGRMCAAFADKPARASNEEEKLEGGNGRIFTTFAVEPVFGDVW